MKLVEVSSNKFKSLADKSEQITFHQTKEWGKLKEKNGWHSYFLSLEEKGKSYGCTLMLTKDVPLIKKRICYCPRGFLIDYKNEEILKIFTQEIKEFAQKKNAIFIKIDPYVSYKQRNLEGDLVEGGFNNSEVVENLQSLGYKHFGFNLMQDTLQPRWMHTITLRKKTLDDIMKDMESKTRQILRKNERCAITTREITREELPKFKHIMQHTSDRREFVDRPLSYYENMWDNLYDSGILKILIAEIDFDKYKKNTEEEINEIQKEMEDRRYKKENNILKMNEKKFNSKQKQEEDRKKQLEKQLTEIEEYQYKYGHKALLGGILFLVYGNEVLSLYGGSLKELMHFQSAYTLHFAGIKYALDNHYDTYNFYGITGDFRKENPLFGLYLFKKSFGGQVVELVGEFDLIISPFWYKTYNTAFKIYHGIKNIGKKQK